MATARERRVYQEGDLVDEHLLNQLSKWILYHRLGALARDLGMSQAEFSRIPTPWRTPEEQIFKVNLQFIYHFGQNNQWLALDEVHKKEFDIRR